MKRPSQGDSSDEGDVELTKLVKQAVKEQMKKRAPQSERVDGPDDLPPPRGPRRDPDPLLGTVSVLAPMQVGGGAITNVVSQKVFTPFQGKSDPAYAREQIEDFFLHFFPVEEYNPVRFMIVRLSPEELMEMRMKIHGWQTHLTQSTIFPSEMHLKGSQQNYQPISEEDVYPHGPVAVIQPNTLFPTVSQQKELHQKMVNLHGALEVELLLYKKFHELYPHWFGKEGDFFFLKLFIPERHATSLKQLYREVGALREELLFRPLGTWMSRNSADENPESVNFTSHRNNMLTIKKGMAEMSYASLMFLVNGILARTKKSTLDTGDLHYLAEAVKKKLKEQASDE